jgi:hypothetical protein
MAHNDLARSYEETGEADLAATHCELAVKGEDELGSLVTGADLRLARLIIRSGWRESYEQADALLDHAERAGLTMRSDAWEWCVSRARLAAARGDGDAASYAARALELLAQDGPQFPRHPDVGIIQADDATADEMRALAHEGPS